MSILFEVEGKELKKINTLAKKRLNACLKYGFAKTMTCSVSYIIDMEKQILHPIVLIYQTINPWGAIYYPAKIFSTPHNLETSVVFNTTKFHGQRYAYSQGMVADVSIFKKWLDSNKKIEVKLNTETNRVFVSHNGLEFTEEGYDDKFFPTRFTRRDIEAIGNIPDLTQMMLNSDINRTRNVIDNEEILTNLDNEVVSYNSGNYNYLEEDGTFSPLLLFKSVYPFIPEAIELFQETSLIDDSWISSVALITYYQGSRIYVYYKYVNVWYNTRKRNEELQKGDTIYYDKQSEW